MALAAVAPLSAHFTAGELGADSPAASGAVVGNLRAVAGNLEAVRALLGVPLRVTSGFRTAAENAAAGGAPTSSHLDGLAVDFVPVGLSQFGAYKLLRSANDAGQLPAFDQLEFDVLNGHIHIGYGPKQRREFLIKLSEGNLSQLSDQLAAKLRGYVPDALAGLIALAVFAVLLILLLPGIP